MLIQPIQVLQTHATKHVQSALLAVKVAANVAKVVVSVAASAVSVATKVAVKMWLVKMQTTWAMRKPKCHSTLTHRQLPAMRMHKALKSA